MDAVPEPTGPDRRPLTAAEAKALGHPTRLRILFACRDRARTNKELAERLGSTPGTIHYHLRTLVEQGFLRAEEVRPGPRGSRQQPYRATGRSWEVAGDRETTAALVEASLDELGTAGDERVLAVSRLGLSLPAHEIEGFVHEVGTLLDRIATRSRAREPGAEDERVAVFFTVTRDVPEAHPGEGS